MSRIGQAQQLLSYNSMVVLAAHKTFQPLFACRSWPIPNLKSKIPGMCTCLIQVLDKCHLSPRSLWSLPIFQVTKRGNSALLKVVGCCNQFEASIQMHSLGMICWSLPGGVVDCKGGSRGRRSRSSTSHGERFCAWELNSPKVHIPR